MGKHLAAGEYFTTVEAAPLAGASYFQLNRWCAKGWIPGVVRSPGTGIQRVWSAEAIEVARWLAVASNAFVPDGYLNLSILADFVRRAAEAGVKP